MTDGEANSLTRRKYLQGGAALAAGAALAGCGGGEDEQLAVQSITVSSADESAGGARDQPMAAAYTRLIPMSTVVRQVWHIEVAFRGSYGTKVEIIDKNNKATVIGEKAVGDFAVHHLQFAEFETAPVGTTIGEAHFNSVRDLTKLRITLWNSSTTHVNTVGNQNNNVAAIERFDRSNPAETEWLMTWGSSTVTSANWHVAVRFFRALEPDVGDRRSAYITGISRYEPHHDNATSTLGSNATFMEGVPNSPTTHAAITKLDPIANTESLLLPSHRHAGHYEIVKPGGFNFSSVAAKAATRRRLLRHMERFGEYVENDGDTTTATIGAKANRIYNELMKVLFGTDISAKMLDTLQNTIDKIKAETNHAANDAIETLCSYVDNLDTTDNWSDIKRMLDDTPKQDNPGTGGEGVGAGVALQAKVTGNFTAPYFGPSHAGVRVSVLLARAAALRLSVNGVLEGKTSTYRISERNSKGIKLTITALAGPNWDNTKLSVDVELSISLTVKKNASGVRVCRIDAVQFELVGDFNLRDWTARCIEKACGKLLRKLLDLKSGGNPELARASAISPTATLWQSLAVALHPATTSSAVVAATVQKLENAAVEAITNSTRTWSLLELSVFRMGVFNTDTYDTYTEEFRGGWRGGGGFAWQPGVKYLAGTGFEIKAGSSKLGADGVFRILAGSDSYIMFGTRAVQGAVLEAAVAGGGSAGGD